MQRQSSNGVLALVAFIVFLDMVGVGLIVPVLPDLIAELGQTNNDNAAVIGGFILFVYALMQFLFAPIIGGLSDRFGRRPVLLTTLAAMGIDYGFMALAPSLAWLFVGRAISGIMGATWAAANSCIADLYPPSERGAKFGLLGGAGAAGFVAGPALGGVLGEASMRLPFIAASILALLGAAAGIIFFTETHPPGKRRTFSLGRANPLGTILQMARIPMVIGLLCVLFIFQLGSQSQLSVWAFFLKEEFSWSPLQIGLSVALFGVMLVFAQGFLTGKAISRVGERRTAGIGLLFAIPSYLILAFADSGLAIYAGIIVGGFSGIAFPAIQAQMTRMAPENAQGELQGAVASMMSITAIIGPLLMSRVFAHFSDEQGIHLPGAPFLLAALLGCFGLFLYFILLRRHAPRND